MKAAIDKLKPEDRTATGEGIFTALQAIATVGAVIGGGDGPPPARIVLYSDGKETVPTNPDSPEGASPRPGPPRTRVCRSPPFRSVPRTASSRSTASASRCPSMTHAEEDRRALRRAALTTRPA